jgi:hypothetical protein
MRIACLFNLEESLGGRRMTHVVWELGYFVWCTRGIKGSFRDPGNGYWIHLFWSLYVDATISQTPLMKFLRGFSFFQKTNVKKSIALFGYHHPDSITWFLSSWLYWDTQGKKWRARCMHTNGGWKVSIETPWFQWTLDKQMNVWKENVPIILDKARRQRRNKFIRKAWGKNYFQGSAKKKVVESEVDKLIAQQRLKFEQETGANVLEMKRKPTQH